MSDRQRGSNNILDQRTNDELHKILANGAYSRNDPEYKPVKYAKLTKTNMAKFISTTFRTYLAFKEILADMEELHKSIASEGATALAQNPRNTLNDGQEIEQEMDKKDVDIKKLKNEKKKSRQKRISKRRTKKM